MSAPLLYKMIKSKTEYPLHKAIKVEREDVVFLYLIEMDAQVSSTQISLIFFCKLQCNLQGRLNLSHYARSRFGVWSFMLFPLVFSSLPS